VRRTPLPVSRGSAPRRSDDARRSTIEDVESLLVLAAGVLILGMIWSDRAKIGTAWRRPARFWKRDEYWESRAPSQPLNVVAGVILGLAAVTYGIVTLVT